MIAKLKVGTYQRPTYPGELMDQVLGILDSKIQYQEFKINQAVKSYVDLEPVHGISGSGKKEAAFKPILENNARVLENIDRASHMIKLIYIMRKRLNHANAKMVLNIMSTNNLEQFSDQNIKDYFDRPWMKETRIA